MPPTDLTDELDGLKVWGAGLRRGQRHKVTITGVDEHGRAWGTYRVGRHFQRYIFTEAQTQSIREQSGR